MSHSQQFCFKWNNHTNIINEFKSFLSVEAMVDVTLACDGMSLKAHKIILSACSPFFKSLFLENPCKHPIVIMKDMKYTELKAIVEFIYHGEVSVAEDQIASLIKTAQALKVKGLGEVESQNSQPRDEPKNQSDVEPETVVESINWRSMQNQSAICQSMDGDYDTRIKQEVSSDDLDYARCSNASTLSLQSLGENPSNTEQDEQPPEQNFLDVPSNLAQTSFPGPSCQSPIQSSMKLDQNLVSCSVPLARLDLSFDGALLSDVKPGTLSASPHESVETELEENPVKSGPRSHNSISLEVANNSDTDSRSIPDKTKNSERVNRVTKLHKCTKCSFETIYFHNLKEHCKRRHFKGKQRDRVGGHHAAKRMVEFPCSLCPYKSAKYKSLREHVRNVHERKHFFKCRECDYRASYRACIEKHVIVVHEKKEKLHISDLFSL